MKKTVKGRVHCSENDLTSFHIFNSDMTDYGYISLAEFEVEVEIPPASELTAEAIRRLRVKQDRIQEKAAEAIAGVEETIRSLSLLTYVQEASDGQPAE